MAPRLLALGAAVLALAVVADALQLNDDLSPVELGVQAKPPAAVNKGEVKAMEVQLHSMRKPVKRVGWKEVQKDEKHNNVAVVPPHVIATSKASRTVSSSTIAADLAALHKMSTEKKTEGKAQKTAAVKPTKGMFPAMPVIAAPKRGVPKPPPGLRSTPQPRDKVVEGMMAKIKAMRTKTKPVSWTEVKKEEHALKTQVKTKLPKLPVVHPELGDANTAAANPFAIHPELAAKPAPAKPVPTAAAAQPQPKAKAPQVQKKVEKAQAPKTKVSKVASLADEKKEVRETMGAEEKAQIADMQTTFHNKEEARETKREIIEDAEKLSMKIDNMERSKPLSIPAIKQQQAKIRASWKAKPIAEVKAAYAAAMKKAQQPVHDMLPIQIQIPDPKHPFTMTKAAVKSQVSKTRVLKAPKAAIPDPTED